MSHGNQPTIETAIARLEERVNAWFDKVESYISNLQQQGELLNATVKNTDDLKHKVSNIKDDVEENTRKIKHTNDGVHDLRVISATQESVLDLKERVDVLEENKSFWDRLAGMFRVKYMVSLLVIGLFGVTIDMAYHVPSPSQQHQQQTQLSK